MDTTALQTAYSPQELPAHDRFGHGQRYCFGSTLVDVYSDPPELTPVVQMRMVKGYLAVGDVLHILPSEAGGVHIDYRNGACELGNTGDLALVYTPPKPETLMRTSPEGPIGGCCLIQYHHISSLRIASMFVRVHRSVVSRLMPPLTMDYGKFTDKVGSFL